jgi:uncharacterized protein YciI
MACEIPDGVSIESIWAVEGTYAADAAERRPAYRAEHLAGIARLLEAEVVLEAGAFTDMSGSLLLVRAPDEAAARALAEQDVYHRSGIWSAIRVRAFGRVSRQSGRQPG